ncbi:MAG: hypothetical protein IT292_03725 [Deltaproteobacteria bacterium]|nr:hypothetical protein [Deltaproteobacteria bacterium]
MQSTRLLIVFAFFLVIYLQNYGWINQITTINPSLNHLSTQAEVVELQKQTANFDIFKPRQSPGIITFSALKALNFITNNFTLSLNLLILASLFAGGIFTYRFLQSLYENLLLSVWGGAMVISFLSASTWLTSIAGLALFILPLILERCFAFAKSPSRHTFLVATECVLLSYLFSPEIYTIAIFCFGNLTILATFTANKSNIIDYLKQVIFLPLSMLPWLLHSFSRCQLNTCQSKIDLIGGYSLGLFSYLAVSSNNLLWGNILGNFPRSYPLFFGAVFFCLFFYTFFTRTFVGRQHLRLDKFCKYAAAFGLLVFVLMQITITFILDDIYNSGAMLILLFISISIFSLIAIAWFPREDKYNARQRTSLLALMLFFICLITSFGTTTNDTLTFYSTLISFFPVDLVPLKPFFFALPLFCLTLAVSYYGTRPCWKLKGWKQVLFLIFLLFGLVEHHTRFDLGREEPSPKPRILDSINHASGEILFLPLASKGLGESSTKRNYLDYVSWVGQNNLELINHQIFSDRKNLWEGLMAIDSFPAKPSFAIIDKYSDLDYLIYHSDKESLFNRETFTKTISAEDFPFRLIAELDGVYLFHPK